MPEGPEVAQMADLLKVVIGETLVCIEGTHYNLEPLLDLTVKNVSSHGKKIWIDFDKKGLLCQPLMAGWWTLQPTQYTKVGLIFSNHSVYYNDTRFGKLQVMDPQTYSTYISQWGPDIMKDKIDLKELLIKKKNWLIGKTLLEQKIISGIGNYIKSEGLYLSQISPYRKVGSLTDQEFKTLLHHIQWICTQAYLNDYTCLVYQKDYDPFNRKVEKVVLTDQRSTFWVPEYQK